MVFWIALLIWATALFLTLCSALMVLRYFDKDYFPESYTHEFPPISILKPICGFDSGLKANIESFFHLDYPEYELLFSFREECPAKEMVTRLMEKYPDVPARIFVTNDEIGSNPKINNIYRSYKESTHDMILISDSSIRVHPSYLGRLVLHFDDMTGVVTSVVIGKDARTLGGMLEAMHLNTFITRGMILCHALNFPTVMGKSMLMSKAVMEMFGGLDTLSRYLAEDYMTGQLMHEIKFETVVAHEPLEQYIGKYTVGDFWRRHVRWGRIRKTHEPLAFFTVEPLLGCIVSGLLGAFALQHFWPGIFLYVFAAHLLFWFLCDFLVLHQHP